MKLRLQAHLAIVAFVVTLLFVLYPTPYLMVLFVFFAQPLFLIVAVMYLHKVFRDLREKEVL